MLGRDDHAEANRGGEFLTTDFPDEHGGEGRAVNRDSGLPQDRTGPPFHHRYY